MACAHTSTSEYSSYAAYVSKLAELDWAYGRLARFFTNPDLPYPNVNPYPEVPDSGSVVVIDSIQDVLRVQRFAVSQRGRCEDQDGLFQFLDTRPPESQARIVIIDYYRSWYFGWFLGLDRAVVDKIALQHCIHPEILRLHFGSDHLLSSLKFREEPSILSAFTINRCPYLQYGHGFLTACFHDDCTCLNTKTLVILARNDHIPNHEGVIRAYYPTCSFPVPSLSETNLAPWTNVAYLRSLQELPKEVISTANKNFVEFLIPYAEIAAITEEQSMALWNMKVKSNAGDLLTRYMEQSNTLSSIKSNMRTVRRFAMDSAIPRYTELLTAFENITTRSEEQIDDLRLLMNYRASLNSLEESRIGVKYAKQGIAYTEVALSQNARVKKLTQLAFVFIPLSTITSIFGMNVDILESGSAQVWMVAVAAIIAYILVICLWGILSSPIRELAQRSWARLRSSDSSASDSSVDRGSLRFGPSTTASTAEA